MKSKRIITLCIGAIVTIASNVTASLRPSASPMSTPYKNDKTIIYNSAFYDPKHHDDGRPINALNSDYTTEEEEAILKRIKLLQNIKFKRGITNSVDFIGQGDSLAMESGNSEKKLSSQVLVKVVQKSNNLIKDQIQTESQQNKQKSNNEQSSKASEQQKKKPSAFNPYQQSNYYDNYDPLSSVTQYVGQWKNELVHGRRKFRGYYLKPHRTPSFGNIFMEMGSKIGYW